MKSVLIVGAGPAGLVTAKNLLQRKDKYSVTILEKQPRVGGLWAVSKNTTDSTLDPCMPTNLSKYTVGFSDLSWDSVNLAQDDRVNVFGNKESTTHVPMFPLAWQVGRYLDTYARKFIPEGVIRFNKTVVSAEVDATDKNMRWTVTWVDSADDYGSSGDHSPTERAHRCSKARFDHLVIASGFFANPKPLPNSVHHDRLNEKIASRLVHSSHLRNIEDLALDQSETPRNLVVIGGSMSGAESAASLALQLSSKKFSPEQRLVGQYNVVHIFSRPFYALPPVLPAEGLTSSSHSFAPLDLCLYNLTRRPHGEISSAFGKVSSKKAQAAHKNIRALVGSDQTDLSNTLVSNDINLPAYVAISERYAEFVRSGDIETVSGRVISLGFDSSKGGRGGSLYSDLLKVELQSNGKTISIENVDRIVYATGYSPYKALDFLSEGIQQKLSIMKEECPRLPVLLDEHYTIPRSLPSMALVGFYEGPYWGVMEMQARYIARKWDSNLESSNDISVTCSGPDSKSLELLREAISQRDSSVPQYWMGDYLGIMEEISSELKIERDDNGFDFRSGPSLPARYTYRDDDQREAQKTLKSLRSTIDVSTVGSEFATRAAFRAIQGRWNIRRDLKSELASFPSGTVSGTAHFHPRIPTDAHFDAEYLYIENGTFKTNQGFTMQATRRYVYRYHELNDQISVWFVKEDGKTVDYLFHNLKLRPDKILNGRPRWKADADHLCVEDMYRTLYHFSFQGIALDVLHLTHSVQGPKKDYTSETHYYRDKL